nr:hypothetical protein [Tanacetum cinerariifolium]GEY18529.1 hypothetical protein [Tanacetum cinerariifolium]
MLGPKELKVECPFKPRSQSKAKSFEGCRSSVRMAMHEVVQEMVVGESHEPNSEGSDSAWKAYINASVAVGECHEPNSEGTGSAWKAYMNVRVAGLFLLVLLEYPNGWMAGPYRADDTTRDHSRHLYATNTFKNFLGEQLERFCFGQPRSNLALIPLVTRGSLVSSCLGLIKGAAPTPDQCSAISSLYSWHVLHPYHWGTPTRPTGINQPLSHSCTPSKQNPTLQNLARDIWLTNPYGWFVITTTYAPTHISHFFIFNVEESVNEHEIGDDYLTEKQQQLVVDEEALKETLDEEERVKKKWEERIRQEQAHDELFMLEFGVKSDSESVNFVRLRFYLAMYCF